MEFLDGERSNCDKVTKLIQKMEAIKLNEKEEELEKVVNKKWRGYSKIMRMIEKREARSKGREGNNDGAMSLPADG